MGIFKSKKDDETWQDKQITEKFKGKSAPHWQPWKLYNSSCCNRQERTGSRFPHTTAHIPALPGAKVYSGKGSSFAIVSSKY
jgi:hypothetical protein